MQTIIQRTTVLLFWFVILSVSLLCLHLKLLPVVIMIFVIIITTGKQE
jgi:hypothetical protein